MNRRRIAHSATEEMQSDGNYIYTAKQIAELTKPLAELLYYTNTRIQEITTRVQKQKQQIEYYVKAITDADLYVDSLVYQQHPLNKNIAPLMAQCTTITGRRSSNEDEEIGVLLSYQKQTFYQIYSVFDGHAGTEASLFCKQNFVKYLSENKFLQFNLIEQAIKDTFLQLDEEFCKRETKQDNVGTTAACVVFDLQNDQIFISNTGDARVVISSTSGKIFTTYDHKPSDLLEQQRLDKFFGTKVLDVNGVMRVNGTLAVSRSIGDVEYKIFGVTSKPDVTKVNISITQIKYCIVACDGLFDVFTNRMLDIAMKVILNEEIDKLKPEEEDLAEGIQHYCNGEVQKGDDVFIRMSGSKDNDPDKAVKIDKDDTCGKASYILVRAAYYLNSSDNITCIVILRE